MSWIKTIPYKQSSGRLRTLYDRVKGPNGKIDNILQLHSLRPHSLAGHMQLYKSVLHHASNEVPKWFLETIGVYVSLLNACAYCVEHHFAGLRRLLNDDARAAAIRRGLETERWEGELDDQQLAVLDYVRQLTQAPASIRQEHAEALRSAGLSDGEILEINQVTAYFAYANRTVLGLGCSLAGDVLGLSPGKSDDPDNWHHA